MTSEIILQVHTDFKNSLATVRDIESLKIAEHEGFIWVRGMHDTHELTNSLYQVRFMTKYLLRDMHLFMNEYQTPERLFFDAVWIPIKTYIPVKLPVAALKGASQHYEIVLKLKKTTSPERSVALLSDKKSVEHYMISAPSFRFDKLTFAVSSLDQVLIFGTPLLPIIGKELWAYKNVLIPSGYTFLTKYHIDLLKQSEDQDTILLVEEDNSYQAILKKNIQPLHRNAFIS